MAPTAPRCSAAATPQRLSAARDPEGARYSRHSRHTLYVNAAIDTIFRKEANVAFD